MRQLFQTIGETILEVIPITLGIIFMVGLIDGGEIFHFISAFETSLCG